MHYVCASGHASWWLLKRQTYGIWAGWAWSIVARLMSADVNRVLMCHRILQPVTPIKEDLYMGYEFKPRCSTQKYQLVCRWYTQTDRPFMTMGSQTSTHSPTVNCKLPLPQNRERNACYTEFTKLNISIKPRFGNRRACSACASR